MTLPPAGWYLDPDGSAAERWFDGATWSDFKRAAPAPQPSEPKVSTEKMAPAEVEPPIDDHRTPEAEWTAAVGHWREVMDDLPTQSSMKRGMFASWPKGYSPGELQNKTLSDIAKAWGRPEWWLPEPLTGGLTGGWNTIGSQFAMHIDHEGRCDEIFMRKPNELELSWSMRRLGNLMGKPAAQIEQAVGLPQARSSIGQGLTLLQWHTLGYHDALKFDVDMYCLGITSQHASRPM